MVHDPSRRPRSFGLSVGSVLVAIGAVLIWRGRLRAAEVAIAIGAVLIVAGALRPALLAVPSAIWWRVALVLGWVNARIILTLAFALVLTPIGWMWRVAGRDPLGRRRQSFPGWAPYPARHQARDHYRQMF